MQIGAHAAPTTRPVWPCGSLPDCHLLASSSPARLFLTISPRPSADALSWLGGLAILKTPARQIWDLLAVLEDSSGSARLAFGISHSSTADGDQGQRRSDVSLLFPHSTVGCTSALAAV